MSDSSRRDRGALIALGISLAAVVLVVWLSQPANELSGQAYTHNTEYPYEHLGPAEGHWWPEASARDTYAQWLMAVLSIVATGVSFWAVILVRNTLEHTRIGTAAAVDAAKAAMDSSRILHLEQRPWLTLRRDIDCFFSIKTIDENSPIADEYPFDATLVWKYDIENVGKSPAFGVKVKTKIISSDSFFKAEKIFISFVESINMEWETAAQDTIFPSEKIKMKAFRIWSAVKFTGTEKPKFFLLFAIAYRSYSGDIIGLEARLLAIDFAKDSLGPWTAKLLEHRQARITR